MGTPYYQFCPIAKAMELLGERWTMLTMREMLLGTEHFSEFRRGLPRPPAVAGALPVGP